MKLNTKRMRRARRKERKKNQDAPPIRSALKRCTSRSRGIQTHLGFENRETKHLGGEKNETEHRRRRMNKEDSKNC